MEVRSYLRNRYPGSTVISLDIDEKMTSASVVLRSVGGALVHMIIAREKTWKKLFNKEVSIREFGSPVADYRSPKGKVHD